LPDMCQVAAAMGAARPMVITNDATRRRVSEVVVLPLTDFACR